MSDTSSFQAPALPVATEMSLGVKVGSSRALDLSLSDFDTLDQSLNPSSSQFPFL